MPRNNNKNNKKVNDNKEQKMLLEKTDESEYAIITKKLGSGRFSAKLNMNGNQVNARLCGKFRKGAMKKNNMVDVGTVVLVGIRNYDEKNVDIIYVYSTQDVRTLEKEKKIFFDMQLIQNETIPVENEQDTFVFEDI
jgi:initiation factor 1A